MYQNKVNLIGFLGGDAEVRNANNRSFTTLSFSDTEAEIGEAVDFVVHIERKPGSRVVREVLAIRGYDRDAKRFLIDPVMEANHAA